MGGKLLSLLTINFVELLHSDQTSSETETVLVNEDGDLAKVLVRPFLRLREVYGEGPGQGKVFPLAIMARYVTGPTSLYSRQQ